MLAILAPILVFGLVIFVHELGHAIALRHEGIPTSPILFVPFLGAVIGMRALPRNAWIEAALRRAWRAIIASTDFPSHAVCTMTR